MAYFHYICPNHFTKAINMENIINDIKKECRLAMNGAVSSAMRERGIVYKLNFGVEYPRIREIAKRYEKSHELAQELWKTDIRELKIIAGLLQPVESFVPEIAEIWMDSINNCELAEMTSMNLFSKLPYAGDISFKWIASENEFTQYCGFLTLNRILSSGMELNERAANELVDQAVTHALSPEVYPRQAALNLLATYAGQNKTNNRTVMNIARQYQNSDKELEKEFYNYLKFATCI